MSQVEQTDESLLRTASQLNILIGGAISQDPQARLSESLDTGFRKSLTSEIDLALSEIYPKGVVIDLSVQEQWRSQGVLMAHADQPVLSFFPVSGPSVPIRTDYVFSDDMRKRVVLENPSDASVDEVLEDTQIPPQDLDKIVTALNRLTDAVRRNYPNLG